MFYKLLLRMEFRKESVAQFVKDGGRDQFLKSPTTTVESSCALFGVGATVETTRRKQPGFNQSGGVATVTKVSVVGGEAFYDVKYNDSTRTETSLPESILTPFVPSEGRKKRASQPSSTGEKS